MKAVSVNSNTRRTPHHSSYEDYFVVEEVYYEDSYSENSCSLENSPKLKSDSSSSNSDSHSRNKKSTSLLQPMTNTSDKVVTEDNHKHLMCAICMNSIEPTKKARIDNCKHEFCRECIELWAQTKLSCPLCNVNFDKLLVNFSSDEIYEEKSITIAPKGISTTISDDLQCLDHTYFLQEINRLIVEIETMQRKLVCQSQSRLKNTWESTKSTILQNLVSTLRAYRESFSNFCSFEPELMLRELYELQDELSELRKGPNAISLITKARSQSVSNAPTRYSADDDDDYIDDEFLENIDRMHIKKINSLVNNKKKTQKTKSTKK